ncbi:unnamed protein product [Oncorhynchus mykiss]|uniref:Uncharacterized protein n=1 Tax=Oncorhynchus mykiss TaxID=8022 RepID=A0A060XP88_ONCMY|nr:unnamed protein product [Oncorhynchus mykiss]
MDRVNDLVEFRIDAVLQEMSGATLWVLPLEEPFSCEEFVQTTRELCIKGAQSLHAKSSLVEEATNELINMLLEFELNKEGDEELLEESRTDMDQRKKRDLLEVMEEEAQELLSHFNHRNVDALLRLTRNTLETLRKRLHASSLLHFLGNTSDISASVTQAIPYQARNYYKSVSENKEIIKLVSVLSTSINSTKKVHTGLHTKQK